MKDAEFSAENSLQVTHCQVKQVKYTTKLQVGQPASFPISKVRYEQASALDGALAEDDD